MSILAASNLNESPPKINRLPSPSPSLFSSLPNDIVLEILARVSKHYHPILSCVSKKFQILVRSPEIQKTRSLLGKNSLYICFYDNTSFSRNWFTLRGMEKNLNENLLASVDFSFFRKTNHSSIVAVGPEIFFIGGSESFGSSMWISDSRSGKIRRGPNMQVELTYKSVGLVGSKIYVIGWDKHGKTQAEFFNLKTQTWKRAPVSEEINTYTWLASWRTFVLDRKICWLSRRGLTCYDTRDGTCERVEFPYEEWCSKGVCVIDNVMYAYNFSLGLKWFDTKLRQWRMVDGLDHLKKERDIAMAEYYGKLAYMWTEPDDETKQIWCKMIALDKSEVGLHGTAEPSQLVAIHWELISLFWVNNVDSM